MSDVGMCLCEEMSDVGMCVDLVGCQSVNVGTVMPLRVCMSPQRLRLGRLRGRGDVRRAASFVPFFFGLKEKTLSCRCGSCMYIVLFF